MVRLALQFVDVGEIQNAYTFAPLGSAFRGGPARLAGDSVAHHPPTGNNPG
jgi:hypothetical protein